MSRLVWKELAGQQRVKELLGAAFDSGTLGHAYLFCGEVGVGTFQAALELAMALLCTARDGGVPCRVCSACRKAARSAHPDLRIVLPVALRKEHRANGSVLSQEGWEHLSRMVGQLLTSPYEMPVADGVRTIPVEWIREVMQAVLRGASEGERHVTIMCGVELMNKESANAILKTLEEPPLDSIILLCTDSPQGVLPTIRSRCQVVRFGRLSDDEVREGLRARNISVGDSHTMEMVLDAAQGSLGAALEMLRTPHPEAPTQARKLWALVKERNGLALADGVDELAGLLDAGTAERLLIYCMHLVRADLLAAVRGGTAGDGHALIEPQQAERLLALCARAVRAVRARTLMSLLLLGFVLEAREILDGEKQQPG